MRPPFQPRLVGCAFAPVMSAPNPRKRAAPGTSPMVPMPHLQQSFPSGQPDRLFQWNGGGVDGSSFVEGGPPNVNTFTMMSPPGQYGAAASAPSTALTRRQNNNHALVHAGGRPQFDSSAEAWTAFPNNSSFLQPPNGMADEDSVEELERKAMVAKRDAQGKRKQIPPFVQKLSRYVTRISSIDHAVLTSMQLPG